MKWNNRKKRTYIAILCVVAMLVNIFSPFSHNVVSAEETESSYRELTFSDWGMTNGEYVDMKEYSPTDASITDLNDVAFNGMIDTTSSVAFYIGGKDSGWSGILVHVLASEEKIAISSVTNGYQDLSTVTLRTLEEIQPALNDEAFSLQKEFKLRLTFDVYDTNNLLLGVYINDTQITTIDFNNGIAAAMGTKFMVYLTGSDLDLRDVVNGEPAYQELKLKDFDIYPGTLSSDTIGTNDDIMTLDEVAVSGKVKYGSGWLMLGHESADRGDWSGIQTLVDEDGKSLKVSGVLFKETELSHLNVTSTSGSTYSTTAEGYVAVNFDGTATWCDVNFDAVAATSEIHVFLKNDSEYPRYVQMNWAAGSKVLDENGNEITNIEAGATKIPANSGWCEVIYSGTSFNQFNCISQGGASTSVGTLLIKGYYTDNAGEMHNFIPSSSQISSEEAGVDFANDMIDLRYTFDYTDTGVDMGIYVDGSFIKTISFGASTDGLYNIKDCLGKYIMATSGFTSEGIYQELNFADFGIPTGTLKADTSGTNDSITSLDGVAVSGKVRIGSSWLMMGHESVDRGDWSGIQMFVGSDGKSLTVAGNLNAYPPLSRVNVTSTTGSTYSTTEEGYVAVNFDGTVAWCDVNFDAVAATSEIHVFMKNDSEYPRYVQLDWTTASKVLDENGNDVTASVTSENATKIPANSGWYEVIYSRTSSGQFNCVSQGGPSTSVGTLLIKGYYVDSRTEQNYSFTPSSTQISSDEAGVDFANDIVDVRYTFDYTNTGVAMGVHVNGNYIKTIAFEDSSIDSRVNIKDVLGKCIMATTGFASYTEAERREVSYNLEDGAYLVSGNAVVLKNGNEVALTDCAITTPGDYEIITNVSENGTKYSQNVALYILGDVDLNGTAAEENDLVALEAIYTSTSFKANSAAEKAADLDNDGMVDAEDWQLMKQILADTDSAAELKAVKDKYHVAAKTYDYLGGNDVMPIVGYYGPYNNEGKDFLTDAYFKLVKDSGINLVNYSQNSAVGDAEFAYVTQALELAEKHQIGYFLNDFSLNTDVSSINTDAGADNEPLSATDLAAKIGRYGYYDSFLGIHITDEPVYKDSAVYNQEKSTYEGKLLENYTDVSKQLNSYSNLTGFINLAPEDSAYVNFSTENWWEFWNPAVDYFDEYFTQYMTNAKPQVISIDDYPFNDNADEGVTNASGYFRTLSKTRAEAKNGGIPFWWYVQAGGNFQNTDSNRYSYDAGRVALETETYWNVNTALAFGAKGIEWFTLIQSNAFHDEILDSQGTDVNGLIDADGDTTKFYGWAQNINNHIKNVDEVLMKAENKGVITTGGYAASQVEAGYEANQAEDSTFKSPVITASDTSKLVSVTSVDATTGQADAYGTIVGCFDYRDTEAYYVMNYNVTSETSQTVTLELNGNYNYRVIQQGQSAYSVIGTTCELTIPAGEAVLVVLDGVTGDANGDGMFDVRDLVRHKRVDAKEPRIAFSQGYEAYLNKDGIADKLDTMEMRYYLANGKFGEYSGTWCFSNSNSH